MLVRAAQAVAQDQVQHGSAGPIGPSLLRTPTHALLHAVWSVAVPSSLLLHGLRITTRSSITTDMEQLRWLARACRARRVLGLFGALLSLACAVRAAVGASARREWAPIMSDADRSRST